LWLQSSRVRRTQFDDGGGGVEFYLGPISRFPRTERLGRRAVQRSNGVRNTGYHCHRTGYDCHHAIHHGGTGIGGCARFP
jgi:hypothetical protein